MSGLNLSGVDFAPWVSVPLIYVLWVSVFLILKRLIFNSLRKMASRTKTELDDVLIRAADFPLALLIFTSGGVVVERVIPALEGTPLTNNFLIGFKVATIVAIVLFLDRLVNGLVLAYTDKVEILKTSSGFAQGLSRLVILGLGLLVLLDNFGISVTPVLASLGIGSLAVALALQPTLENFFAGIQLIIDKPIQVGHFVKLESGEEGYVNVIGWRSTWVKLLSNNMVVVPNKVLINSKITNYYYPGRDLTVLVEVGVHYGSDLEKVEQVTVEVATQLQQAVPGAVKDFSPFIRYHTFSGFSINFTVILRAQEFVDGYLMKHEFIKRLHKRYAEEGIIIPYPIRAINYVQEEAFTKSERS